MKGPLVFYEASLGRVASSLGCKWGVPVLSVPSGALHPTAPWMLSFLAFPPFPFVPNVVFRARTWSKILSNWNEEAELGALWDLRAGTDTVFSFLPALKK